MTDGRHFENS